MIVVPQVMGGHFADGKAFDFSVHFFIVNPRNKAIEAFYVFDKYGSAKRKDKETGYAGSLDFNTAEKKPFSYDTLAGKWMEKVDAQVDLESSRRDRFTLTVSRPKKTNFSVDLTFMGELPKWLADGQVWPGKLMMYEVKDFNARP